MEKYGFTWGNLQSIATLLVMITLAVARTMWTSSEVKKKVDAVDSKLNLHIENPALHRNPDSERRWERVEKQLDRIELDVLAMREGK